MFKGLGNLANIMKQAQQMGAFMQNVSDELKRQTVTGSAGGGMVEVDANGIGEILAFRIDPKLLAQQDRELLEDLLTVAVNQTLAKAKTSHTDALKAAAGGMDLPGLDEVMSKLSSEPKA